MTQDATARAAAGSGRRGGSARRALWTTLRTVCIAAALAHLAFLILFAGLGLPLLSGANVASIALFIGTRALLLRRRNTLAISLIVGEVAMHATVASVLLGWDGGFHYYLLTLVGPLLVGMNGTTASKVARVVAFGAGYAALDRWTSHSAPIYRLEPWLLDSIRYANIAGMLAIMTFVSMTYYRLVVTAESALRRLASTDPLTGLHNRRRLLEIVRATRGTGPGAPGMFVLLCDIDHFKLVNDRHGHDTGDRVLQRVADAIAAAVRATDSVARWGGEEFVVLLAGADPASAMQTGERIRSAVASLSVQRAGSAPQAMQVAEDDVPVTITIGVSRLGPATGSSRTASGPSLLLPERRFAGRAEQVDRLNFLPGVNPARSARWRPPCRRRCRARSGRSAGARLHPAGSRGPAARPTEPRRREGCRSRRRSAAT
jgi:diguanylate cyclase (GGDEF)-like protein